MELKEEIALYQQLRFEQDGRLKEDLSTLNESQLKTLLSELKVEHPSPDEPDDLDEIIKVSSFDDVRLDVDDIENRIKGAILGRFAGCLLGVPVENYSIARMKEIAKMGDTPFPPTEYWHKVDREDWIQYGVDRRGDYTLPGINAVFVDDDITYTILNLIALKRFGAHYSTEDMAKLWLEVLPYACTAEDSALQELRAGINAKEVANNNPFIEWIGAAIRADAFGYVFAGRPRLAAIAAYNDAYLTHRRNGIYGEMFLAAAISFSFSIHPLEAIKKAINYIPKNSRLHKDIDWALSYEGKIRDFEEARRLIDERFTGMDGVHTNNNMCVITFATMLGGSSYTDAVSTCVAMGLDNDCTGASIGSMFGAYYSLRGVDKKWYANFNDTVHTYLKGFEKLRLSDVFCWALDIYAKNLSLLQ